MSWPNQALQQTAAAMLVSLVILAGLLIGLASGKLISLAESLLPTATPREGAR